MRKITQRLVVCLIAILCVFISFGCEKRHSDTLPPDYQMTCDGKGNYIALMPQGIECTDNENKPYNTKQKAIDRAWRQYEYQESIKEYKWQKCD